MSRFLVLLPAPEAEWAALPPEEHEKGMRSHEQFQRDLADGQHTIVATSPLEPSAPASSRSSASICSTPTTVTTCVASVRSSPLVASTLSFASWSERKDLS